MIQLSTQNLSKIFGGVTALNKVSLNVEHGSIHGLIGPNGSGKTTFFNVVSGMLPATKGSIEFERKPISGLSADRVTRLGISRTFQKPTVMPRLSCLENVMAGMYGQTSSNLIGTMFHSPFKRSAQEQMIYDKSMEMLDFVGLRFSADKWASNLTWAEQQLLQLARALMNDPKLLLLDEPVSGMGEQESSMMTEMIRTINATGVTIILVSHDINLVSSLSQSVTALEFGKIIAEGPPEIIRKNQRVIDAYLGME